MGQFSMEISGHAGSVLSGNQHEETLARREALRAKLPTYIVNALEHVTGAALNPPAQEAVDDAAAA